MGNGYGATRCQSGPSTASRTPPVLMGGAKANAAPVTARNAKASMCQPTSQLFGVTLWRLAFGSGDIDWCFATHLILSPPGGPTLVSQFPVNPFLNIRLRIECGLI